MPDTRQPIPVPWANRFRFWLTRRLQACLFVVCVIAVAYLWYHETPRIVLRGQVELVQVVVTASRDGMLEASDAAPDKMDRVERGVTSIVRFDISDALLMMESLTAEREQLQAELDAERLRLQREALTLRWEIAQRGRQIEQVALDQVRLQTSTRQRIDGLRSDVSDLDQSTREWEIKQQETTAEFQRLNLEIESLESSRPQIQQLVESRLAAPSRLVELDRELELKSEMRRQAKQLAAALAEHGADLRRQFEAAKQRLSLAEDVGEERQPDDVAIERHAGNDETGSGQTDANNDSLAELAEVIDAERSLEPFVRAIAVQDAKIRVLAHQIATHEILSPASGQVAEVHQRPGTYVRSGDPIVTITSSEPRWIVAYLNPSDHIDMTSEATVEIRVDGNHSGVFVSKIADRGNHYEELPVVLRDQPEVEQWGVPIKVPVPASMDVKPGQTVQLVIR